MKISCKPQLTALAAAVGIISSSAAVAADHSITLHSAAGEAFSVPTREALPVDAPRARYPGFRQETVILKKGTVRRPGAMPLPCDILLERDAAVTLRDGTTIYVDIFRPTTEGRYPAIMAWSPYGKEIGGQMLDDVPGRAGVPLSATSGLEKFEGPDPAYWVAHGYVIVNPDKRGAYMSEGDILYWGHEDALDGCDVIEWIAAQPWCSGKVGMAGNSWLTVSQWFIAAEQPEHLTAIAPWEGFADHYRESGTRGGIPMPEFPEMLAETFASAHGRLEDQPRMIVEQELMSPYWEDKKARLDQISIPAYVVGSWTNAVHTHGTFAGYRQIKSPEKWLRVHNTNEWHDFYQPEHVEDLRKFFDHYLKGLDNGWDQTPRVRMTVLNPGGEDVVDRVESAFPLPDTQYQKFFLNTENFTLTAENPEAGSVVYNSDDSAADFVVFRHRFAQPFELNGYMKLHLNVAALDHDDMDLAVTVEKKAADGSVLTDAAGNRIMATGFQRLSLRKTDPALSTEAEPWYTFDEVQKVEPGQVVPVDIEIWPIALKFEEGQIMELTVRAYRPLPADIPFGSARISVPRDGYTAEPGTEVEMITVGGGADQCANPAEVVVSPPTHNHGRHQILSGGEHESFLLVPQVERP